MDPLPSYSRTTGSRPDAPENGDRAHSTFIRMNTFNDTSRAEQGRPGPVGNSHPASLKRAAKATGIVVGGAACAAVGVLGGVYSLSTDANIGKSWCPDALHANRASQSVGLVASTASNSVIVGTGLGIMGIGIRKIIEG